MGRRWDTDKRGRGIGDAKGALPALRLLGEAMAEDGWVAEEPELHLLPHIEGAAQVLGIEIRRTAAVDETFEIEVKRGDRSPAEMRAAGLALVGSIAEASTHVRQIGDGDFEVVTGMLTGDSPVFDAHGHLVRIRFV